MKSLRRTRAGGFALEEALTLGKLQQLKDGGRLLEAVRPVDSVFADCPMLHIRKDVRALLENGNPIPPVFIEEKAQCEADRWVRLYLPDENFAGVYAYNVEKRKYMPVKMFLDR